MVSFVETLFVICIICLMIAALAYVQSRSGGAREVKYRARMRRFLFLGAGIGIAAVIGEVLIRIR